MRSRKNRAGLTFITIVLSIIFMVFSEDIVQAEGQIYWTDYVMGKVQKSNAEGGGTQELVTGLGSPRGIAVDLGEGKIYWSEAGSMKVKRSNLNGTGIETIYSGYGNEIYGVALDLSNRKIYWADRTGYSIVRANLDGSAREVVFNTGSYSPYAIALDVDEELIYWTESDWTDGHIWRASYNGIDKDEIVSGLKFPTGLAIDNANDRIYWTERGMDSLDPQLICSANVDGTDSQVLINEGLFAPTGIDLDLAGGKMYWVEPGWIKVRRANLDGTNIENIITGPGGYPAPQLWDIEYVVPEPGTILLLGLGAAIVRSKRLKGKK